MKEPLRPHYALRRAVGKVHAGVSAFNAVRHVVRKFWKRGDFWKESRNARRYAIASIVTAHCENQALYLNVMSGTNGRWVEAVNKYTFDTETKEIGILHT